MPLSLLSLKVKNLLFLVPLLLIGGCVLLTLTPAFEVQSARLSNAVVIDLVLTTPLVYLLIIRSRAIPKTTVVPVILLGMAVATYIIPKSHQELLQWTKDWLLPILELGVLSYMTWTIRKAILISRKERKGQTDFHDIARSLAASIFPKRVGVLVATEISTLYFALVSWKKHKKASSEFTHHQSTSSQLLLYVFIFLILIEAFAFHLLLQNWNPTVAWVFTILSLYSCLQVLAIAKSLPKRPIVVKDGVLKLRWGLVNQVEIPLEKIEELQYNKKEIPKAPETTHLSPLHSAEGTNVVISLKEPLQMDKMYGFRKSFRKIALYLDNPKSFIEQLNQLR